MFVTNPAGADYGLEPVGDGVAPLSERTLHVIKEAIVSLQLPPGAHISESFLSGRLKASRTPIRAALKRLEREGLVRTAPQRGTFVTKLREREVRDAAVMRRLLESWALVEMQRIASFPDLRQLDDLLERQARAVEAKSYNQFLHWDTEFHKAILAAARNLKLLDLYESVNLSILRVRAWLIMERPKALETALAEHRTMYRTIAERRWDLLQQLMLASDDEFLVGVSKMREAHPEYFENAET